MSAVAARTVETTIHGHFLERVPAGPGPHPVLMGFHGYAETAEESLRQLTLIPGAERWLLCAVQGLSAFYKGRTGEVAASWMTRFSRELAIADNLRYVAAVVADLERRHALAPTLVFCGFSQGVAMAYRAALASPRPATAVVALAGDVPPDVAAADLATFPRVLVSRGSADAGYSDEQMQRDLATLAAQGVTAQAFTFNGGHEWTEAFRERVGDYLAACGA